VKAILGGIALSLSAIAGVIVASAVVFDRNTSLRDSTPGVLIILGARLLASFLGSTFAVRRSPSPPVAAGLKVSAGVAVAYLGGGVALGQSSVNGLGWLILAAIFGGGGVGSLD